MTEIRLRLKPGTVAAVRYAASLSGKTSRQIYTDLLDAVVENFGIDGIVDFATGKRSTFVLLGAGGHKNPKKEVVYD